MSTAANRGKDAEGILKKEFQKLDASDAYFSFERIYDARSSLGKMSNPRTGDFVLYNRGDNTVVEVKEVAHDYRLPKVNFSKDQRARMRKRVLCGSLCYVLVYHSTTKVWRFLEMSFFDNEETGSWDFRETRAYTLAEVIEALYTEVKVRKTGWKP